MARTYFSSNDSGFTIIEVLIAVAMFSIGLMAMGALQAGSLMATGDVARRTEAWTIIEEQVGLLKRLRFYNEAPPLAPAPFPPALVAGDFPAHTLNMPLPPAAPRYTVHWRVVDDQPIGTQNQSVLPGVPIGVYTVSKQVTVVVTRLNGNPVTAPLAQVQFEKTWAATGIP